MDVAKAPDSMQDLGVRTLFWQAQNAHMRSNFKCGASAAAINKDSLGSSGGQSLLQLCDGPVHGCASIIKGKVKLKLQELRSRARQRCAPKAHMARAASAII